MTSLPRSLSHSSIDLYRRCPGAWHSRYVLREMPDPTPSMAFGRAMAKALEAMHGGGDWRSTFRAEHARLDWLLRGHRLAIRPGLAYGLELLGLYRERGVYVGVPEQMFRLRLPDEVGVPVPIIGYMDLASPERIWEFKTSSATWTQARADAEGQAPIYWWAGLRLHGRTPESIRYVVLSTNEPAIVELDVTVEAEAFRRFEALAKRVWDGIAAGGFDPCGKISKCEWCKRRQLAGVAMLRCRRGRDDGE